MLFCEVCTLSNCEVVNNAKSARRLDQRQLSGLRHVARDVMPEAEGRRYASAGRRVGPRSTQSDACWMRHRTWRRTETGLCPSVFTSLKSAAYSALSSCGGGRCRNCVDESVANGSTSPNLENCAAPDAVGTQIPGNTDGKSGAEMPEDADRRPQSRRLPARQGPSRRFCCRPLRRGFAGPVGWRRDQPRAWRRSSLGLRTESGKWPG